MYLTYYAGMHTHTLYPEADPGSPEQGCLGKRLHTKRAKIFGTTPLSKEPRPQLGVAVLFK